MPQHHLRTHPAPHSAPSQPATNPAGPAPPSPGLPCAAAPSPPPSWPAPWVSGHPCPAGQEVGQGADMSCGRRALGRPGVAAKPRLRSAWASGHCEPRLPIVRPSPLLTLTLGSAPASSSSFTLPSSPSVQAMSSSRSQGWMPPGGSGGRVRQGSQCRQGSELSHSGGSLLPSPPPSCRRRLFTAATLCTQHQRVASSPQLPLTCEHGLAAVVGALQAQGAGARVPQVSAGKHPVVAGMPISGGSSRCTQATDAPASHPALALLDAAPCNHHSRPVPSGRPPPQPTSLASMPMYMK